MAETQMPGKPQTDGETLPQRGRRVGISMQRLLSIAHACAYASSGGSMSTPCLDFSKATNSQYVGQVV